MNECACGCGELVTGTWKRGHSSRGRGGATVHPLPPPAGDPGGPGDPDGLDDLEDIGIIDPGGLEDSVLDDQQSRDSAGVPDWWDVPPAGPEAPPAGPDPGPAPVGKGKSHRGGGRPPRVTAAVRGDIHAKIRFIAVPLARLWEIRDPVCGGTAVQAEPEISASFLDIVLQSPDLIAFFTGPAAGFMIYVRLFMACLPILQVAYAHHVTHGIADAEDYANSQQPVDPRQYAA